MKTGLVRSHDVYKESCRLTGGFHLSEDQHAYAALMSSVSIGSTLDCYCGPRSIFRGPIFRRMRVDQPENGVPYVSAKDLDRADVVVAYHISRQHGSLLDILRLRDGMILVTCSGMNLGKAILLGPRHEGLCGSHDLIRVLPDNNKIATGYLYAFMASRYANVWMRKQIYGGNIKHVEPEHIARLPIPRFASKLEEKIDGLIAESSKLLEQAAGGLVDAQLILAKEIGKSPVESVENGMYGQSVVPSRAVVASSRLDGLHHNPAAVALDQWCSNHRNGTWSLADVARVFDVPPFKHIYVGPEHGLPFYTSGDLFLQKRRPKLFLSNTQTVSLNKYIMQKGWVLLARSGSLGGIVGRPQFVDSQLDGSTTSDHVIRVVAKNEAEVPAGYIFAYLASNDVGYPLVTRTLAGKAVPALWPIYLDNLRVVKARKKAMFEIDTLVREAFDARARATQKEDEAMSLVEKQLG